MGIFPRDCRGASLSLLTKCHCPGAASRLPGSNIRPLLPVGCWVFWIRDADSQTGKYISLSHRWDQNTHISKTTKSNLNSCRCRTTCCIILPTVFSHVCILAYKLRESSPNVWIDPICIVQDDPDDIRRELVKMAQYYLYSWLPWPLQERTARCASSSGR